MRNDRDRGPQLLRSCVSAEDDGGGGGGDGGGREERVRVSFERGDPRLRRDRVALHVTARASGHVSASNAGPLRHRGATARTSSREIGPEDRGRRPEDFHPPLGVPRLVSRICPLRATERIRHSAGCVSRRVKMQLLIPCKLRGKLAEIRRAPRPSLTTRKQRSSMSGGGREGARGGGTEKLGYSRSLNGEGAR